MKLRKCPKCERMRWVRVSSSEMDAPARIPLCLVCRKRQVRDMGLPMTHKLAAALLPDRVVGAAHPKRVKKHRAPKPAEVRAEKKRASQAAAK